MQLAIDDTCTKIKKIKIAVCVRFRWIIRPLGQKDPLPKFHFEYLIWLFTPRVKTRNTGTDSESSNRVKNPVRVTGWWTLKREGSGKERRRLERPTEDFGLSFWADKNGRQNPTKAEESYGSSQSKSNKRNCKEGIIIVNSSMCLLGSSVVLFKFWQNFV